MSSRISRTIGWFPVLFALVAGCSGGGSSPTGDQQGRSVATWIRNYGLPGGSSFQVDEVVALPGGDFAVAGSTRDAAGARAAWVARLSPDGSPRWSQTVRPTGLGIRAISSPPEHRPDGLVFAEAPDGALVGGVDEASGRMAAARVDGRGRVLWRTVFDVDMERVDALVALSDGGALAAGIEQVGAAGRRPRFVRIDDQGSVVWAWTADAAAELSWIGGVAQAGGDDFVAAGRTAGGGAWLMKGSGQGVLTREIVIDDVAAEWRALRADPNTGQFAVAGWTARNGGSLWFLRVDGNLDTVLGQPVYSTRSGARALSIEIASDGGYLIGASGGEIFKVVEGAVSSSTAWSRDLLGAGDAIDYDIRSITARVADRSDDPYFLGMRGFGKQIFDDTLVGDLFPEAPTTVPGPYAGLVPLDLDGDGLRGDGFLALRRESDRAELYFIEEASPHASRRVALDGDVEVTGLAASADGLLLSATVAWADPAAAGSTYEGLAVRFDLDGPVVWTSRLLRGSEPGAARAVVKNAQGDGWLVAGSIGPRAHLVDLLDADGSIRSKRALDWPTLDSIGFEAIAPLPGGGHVVAGLVGGSRLFLATRATNADLVDPHVYDLEPGAVRELRIVAARDGGVFVAVTLDAPDRVQIVRFDANGSERWSRVFDGVNGRGLCAAPGGGVLLTMQDENLVLARLTWSGEVCWEKRYGTGGEEQARAAVGTAGGGYLIAGASSGFHFPASDGWLLRVDARGDVAPGCIADLSSGAEPLAPRSDGQVLGPALSSAFDGLSVFDLSAYPTLRALAPEIGRSCSGDGVATDDCPPEPACPEYVLDPGQFHLDGEALDQAPDVEFDALVDGSFETGSLIISSVVTMSAGVWFGDLAEIVGADDPAVRSSGMVVPHGDRMIKFVGTAPTGGSPDGSASEQLQILDLTGREADVASGNLIAQASMLVNRVVGDAETDTAFILTVYAIEGPISNLREKWVAQDFLEKRERRFEADACPETWERVATQLTVPTNAGYLLIRIGAIENRVNDPGDGEFDGHFIDRVAMSVELR